MEEPRPDPQTMLELAEAEAQRQTCGKLKIFFGASAGVGKTYAMLEAARLRKKENIDVVIGVVETHKRKETEAMVQGLELLPPKFTEYKNTKLREFDIDAALARKPGLLLVDELAHTNVPGSRNAKRWQDVEELLHAGIDVYTTVNVQHVESLNDVVAKITGVIVKETIPDSIVDRADEIEVIDIPPADLLQRMKEGKVYVGDQAERAANSFFRKGNLIALRELALRCAADRVNQQGQSYRQEKAISNQWPTTERILVCAGPSPFSARLIRAARRMAAGLHAGWTAVYVETPALAAIPDAQRAKVSQNLKLAEQLGADAVTLAGENVVREIVTFARKHNVTKIIIGKPAQPVWKDRLFGSLVDDLIRQSEDIDVYVIKGDREDSEPARPLQTERHTEWAPYLWASVAVGICTGIAHYMFPYFQLGNLMMIYLLGVVIVAIRLGRGPAIFSSVLSVAFFDFFFVPPFLSFAVSDAQYLLTFAIMLTVALMISSLTVQIQNQARDASLREQRTAALYAMSRALASARGIENLVVIATKHVSEVFEGDVVGLLPDATGRLVVKAGNEEQFPFSARERGVAQWVYDLGRPAGMGTETLPGAEALYMPLNASSAVVGVLGLHTRKGGTLSPDQMNMLETFATQTALAIEVDRLTEQTRKAQIETETEKSRSALLSSVSHDLRTPLASICGAAESLLRKEPALPDDTRTELLLSISGEGSRLTRLITNLLEMTKLESGAAKVQKEMCPLEEVVGSALTRLEQTLGKRTLTTNLPGDLPLVPIDVVLMEQVFINLLENAAKYTPPETPIEICAEFSAKENRVKVQVNDRGPGLPVGSEIKIFDKFYRAQPRETPGGSGLGLAICRAIIEAHGGGIWVENRNGGGAAFMFTLPVNTPDIESNAERG